MKPDKSKVSVANQIRGLALQQLNLALEQLTRPTRNYNEAIHQTRRCLKRVRAILRLVRAELGETIFDRDNIYVRNAGRQLAVLRDAAAMMETLDDLKEQFAKELPSSSWREIKKELAAVHRKSTRSRRKVMAAVATRLLTARRRVEKWPLDFDDAAILRTGLQKTYRQGRRAMGQALDESTIESLHEWRKQVNHLRHQLQILREMKIGKVKEALRDFKPLSKALGLNNDLAVLSQHLQGLNQKAEELSRQKLQELIHIRRTALEAEAAELGKQLYQRKPKAFTRQIWPNN